MPKQLCTSGRWNGWKHKSTGPRVKESVHVKAGKGGSCNDSSTPLLARPSSGPPTLDYSQDQIHVTVFYFLFCLHLVYAYLYYTYEVILIVGTHTLLAGKASSVIWILPSFSFLPCRGGAAWAWAEVAHWRQSQEGPPAPLLQMPACKSMVLHCRCLCSFALILFPGAIPRFPLGCWGREENAREGVWEPSSCGGLWVGRRQ